MYLPAFGLVPPWTHSLSHKKTAMPFVDIAGNMLLFPDIKRQGRLFAALVHQALVSLVLLAGEDLLHALVVRAPLLVIVAAGTFTVAVLVIVVEVTRRRHATRIARTSLAVGVVVLLALAALCAIRFL